MSTVEKLERFARSYLPARAARAARPAATYLRYLAQARICREGFRLYGHQYSQHTLFVAGLPKSGTTWLKLMLVSYPGFHELMIPEAIAYERRHGGSHDFDLPLDVFERSARMLAVLKLHSHGSLHNASLLHSSGLKYVVLYRDLRDVAVSHYFYVCQTPWHPEYPVYVRMTKEAALLHFADTLLPAFSRWVQSWHRHQHDTLHLKIRYEDLLQHTEDVLGRVAQHFGLEDSQERIRSIVEAHHFQKMSGGRQQGDENVSSFFRKGVSGDWSNHFTPPVTQAFKRHIGDFLIEFGYESDTFW